MTTDECIASWIDGELGADDAERMAAMYESDPVFAARVDQIRGVDRLVRQVVPLEDVPSELLARLGLEAQQPPAPVVHLGDSAAKRASDARWSLARLASNDMSRLAAAAAVLLGLGLTAGALTTRQGPADVGANYRTLGDETAGPAATGLVVFVPGVSADEAGALVRSAGASVIGGPNEAGAWKLAIEPARREAVLARLHQSPKVAMAESLDGEAK